MTFHLFRVTVACTGFFFFISSSGQAAQTQRFDSDRIPFARPITPGVPRKATSTSKTVSPRLSTVSSPTLAAPAPLSPGEPFPTSSIFFTPTLYEAGLRAVSTIAADINGDGKLDLVTISLCPSGICPASVSVSLGNGDGTFQPALSYPSGGGSAQGVAVADVNSDGKPDIVVADTCGTSPTWGCIGVLLGNGDGSFQPPVSYGTGQTRASAVSIGDVNGDGKPDVVTACAYDDYCTSVSVFLSNGDGTFRNPVNYASVGSNSVLIADVNQDGYPDLVTAGTVLLNNGDGTFHPGPYSEPSCSPVNNDGFTYAALADLNADGRSDLVVIDGNGCANLLPGNGDGSFQTPIALNAGSDPLSVAVADINGDGKPDLIFEDSAASVNVLIGSGDGTFQPPVSYSSGGYGSTAIVADVNSDGKVDLITTNQCADGSCQYGSIEVLLGKGDGTFHGVVGQLSGGQNWEVLAVGDVNGDGQSDIIATAGLGGPDPEEIDVLLGKGDDTFVKAGSYGIGAFFPQAIVIADVNGDDKPDIIIASQYASPSSYDNGVVSVLLGNGDGSFQPAVTYSSGGSNPSSVAVADVNGDGKLDITVSNPINLLFGNGDGTFQRPQTVGSGWSATVADVNGDSKPDLIALNQCSDIACTAGAVSIFLGNGDGSFQPPVNFSSGAKNPWQLAVGDVNKDDKLDVVTANGGGNCGISCDSGSVSVLPGNGDGSFQTALVSSTPPFAPASQSMALADFDGDGNLDVVSLSAGNVLLLGKGDGTFQAPTWLGAVGYGTAAADFNHDGKPDLAAASADVIFVLSNRASAYRYSTTDNLSSSRNPSMLGQTITFTAKVTPAFSAGVITGTVTFYDGANVLANKTLINGKAAFSTPALTLGTHSLTAAYSGNSLYVPTKSSALTETVILRTTKTVVKSSLNPAMVGDTVILTATVTSPLGRPPDGSTVMFADGGVAIGSATLTNGVASLTTSFSTTGPHAITASYQGAAAYAPSTSAALTEKIRAMTSTSLTSSQNPSAVGLSITFMASVTSASGTPAGSVTFRADGALLGTRTLIGGLATLKTSTLDSGTHSVTASFNGSMYFLVSSVTFTQTVQ